MTGLFFYFLLLYLLLIVFSYFSGWIVSKIAKIFYENFFAKIFVNCALGASLIVVSYAVFSIGLHTIFAAAVPLFLYFIFSSRKENRSVENGGDRISSRKDLTVNIISVLVILITVFCVNFFIINQFAQPYWISNANGDYVFYAKISKYLTIENQENVFHLYNEMLPNYFRGLMPYHYYDLWLNNLVSGFHGYSVFLGYALVTIPFLMFVIVAGISAVLSRFLRSSPLTAGFALSAFFFLGGTSLPVYEYLPETGDLANLHFVFQTMPKLYPVYLFLFLFVFSYLTGKKNLAFFSVAFLVFAYSSTLPAIVGGLILLICLNLIFKKYDELFSAFAYLVITISALAVVFAINPTPFVMKGNNQYSLSFVINNFRFEDIKTMINILLSSQYLIGLLYIPGIILVIFTAKSIFKNEIYRFIFILLGLVYLSSIFCWMLFFKELNSGQLFTNVSLPIINVLILLVLSISFEKNRYKLGAIVFIIISTANLLFYAHKFFSERKEFDENYYSEIAELIATNNVKNNIGATLLGSNDYQSIFLYPNTSNLSDNLFVYNDEFQTIPLGDFEIDTGKLDDLSKSRAESLTKITFYRRYLENRLESENYKYAHLPPKAFEHQLQFIIENKIKYAFVSKNYPYWDKISPYVKSYAENKFNQERFIILNPPDEY